jgi:hypothetical protein
MLVKKTLKVGPVTECLRPARTRCGKGARRVSMSEAVRQPACAHILVNKARVKAVTGSNRVDCLDFQSGTTYLP